MIGQISKLVNLKKKLSKSEEILLISGNIERTQRPTTFLAMPRILRLLTLECTKLLLKQIRNIRKTIFQMP